MQIENFFYLLLYLHLFAVLCKIKFEFRDCFRRIKIDE